MCFLFGLVDVCLDLFSLTTGWTRMKLSMDNVYQACICISSTASCWLGLARVDALTFAQKKMYILQWQTVMFFRKKNNKI